MKKIHIILLATFIIVTALGLASNFIPWDETPLEQSIFALPLGIGIALEIPFLLIMGMFIRDTTQPIPYTLLWTVIPIITGAFYTGIVYGIYRLAERFEPRITPKR